jgi:hypothetical protein
MDRNCGEDEVADEGSETFPESYNEALIPSFRDLT